MIPSEQYQLGEQAEANGRFFIRPAERSAIPEEGMRVSYMRVFIRVCVVRGTVKFGFFG
jgi:hypothetical protein